MKEMSNSKLLKMVSATSEGDRVIKDSPLNNIGASVRTRLKQFASVHRGTVRHALTHCAIEQLLYQLSASAYREQFVLNRAIVF